MPRLRYRAVTRAGAREAGFVEAPTTEAAASALRERGLVVIDVAAHDTRPHFLARVRQGDLAEVTRALASLLPAGLPLVRALDVVRDIAPRALHETLADTKLRVERGTSFADALAAHPKIFSASYIGLVRAGERAGALADALAKLAAALEEDAQFRSRLLTAAIYPVLLATVGTGAIVVLLLVVLPRFAALFAQSGSALPASTALVLDVSAMLRAHAGVIGLAALVMLSLLGWIATASDAAYWRARLLLATPGLSALYREVLAARSARIIALLLAGGAPIVTALDDAARSVEAPQAREELLRIRARVREGARVTDALTEGTLYPAMLGRLVGVGEESSQLAMFFARAADLFEDRARRTAARFLAFAEPALIVVFGLIVGAIALALVQAIYGINLTPLRGVR
ncbi:MAG: type II secretion system F family protein [bacterium]